MSRFLDVTYSEKGAVLGLIDRTFIVAILFLSFKPERPRFRLTSPASRSNLKDGREGGSGSNFRLKHTFERGNSALTKLDKMMFVNDEGWWQFVSNMVGPQGATSSSLCINDTAVIKYEKRRHDFRDGSMFKKCADWRRPQCSTLTIPRIPAERMVMSIKCLWFNRQQLVGRPWYLRFLLVMLGHHDAYSLIVSSL